MARGYRWLGLRMPRLFFGAAVGAFWSVVSLADGSRPSLLAMTCFGFLLLLGLVALSWRIRYGYPLWPPEDLDRSSPARWTRGRRDSPGQE